MAEFPHRRVLPHSPFACRTSYARVEDLPGLITAAADGLHLLSMQFKRKQTKGRALGCRVEERVLFLARTQQERVGKTPAIFSRHTHQYLTLGATGLSVTYAASACDNGSLSLSLDEFLARFLLHLLPQGLRPHPQLRLPRQPPACHSPAALLSIFHTVPPPQIEPQGFKQLYRTRPASPNLPAHLPWGVSDTALTFLDSQTSRCFADHFVRAGSVVVGLLSAAILL